ncbi:inorganic phosphate transporter [Corynebacterium sphenisci]|uniref:inorganic phosphate transporter n=1 Tax=Corynebacterium sphenisci TaxID=191493 RepID=UPI0026E02D67|nr:inorganic phosphate transporter [Corynebacterium sphenisci]MDO5731085.1 anion permease [Corynebacterium sphenisci]
MNRTTVQTRPGPGAKAPTDIAWHLSFGVLAAGTLVAFIIWSTNRMPEGASMPILLTTIAFGFFMAFNIGGNDVANSFGTSVGAGTLSMKQALIIAAIFEVGGAVLAGGEVTDTVRSGIVDLDAVALPPLDFAFIMMSSLLGAAIWLLAATRLGWPVSTTHSIIGGIVGAALTLGLVTGTGGLEMVQWRGIGEIAVSWVLSPVLGGLVAWVLYGAIKRYIIVYNEEADARLRHIEERRRTIITAHQNRFERLGELQQNSYSATVAVDDYDEADYHRQLHRLNAEAEQIDANRALETWVPLVAAFGSVVIGAMLLFKGLKNLHLNVSNAGNFIILAMIGAIVWLVTFIFARLLKRQNLKYSTYLLFSWMQVFTAAAFAFSHGSNDIANAIGPFSAVLDVLHTGDINAEAPVPPEALLAMGVILVCGLWFIGRYVIETVGHGLTEMHPASGFAAELAAAGVVMAASVMSLPVSSTHILIGAVLGVGIVNRAANWGLMKPIAMAWVVTLPAAAAVSSACVLVLRLIFG